MNKRKANQMVIIGQLKLQMSENWDDNLNKSNPSNSTNQMINK